MHLVDPSKSNDYRSSNETDGKRRHGAEADGRTETGGKLQRRQIVSNGLT